MRVSIPCTSCSGIKIFQNLNKEVTLKTIAINLSEALVKDLKRKSKNFKTATNDSTNWKASELFS